MIELSAFNSSIKFRIFIKFLLYNQVHFPYYLKNLNEHVLKSYYQIFESIFLSFNINIYYLLLKQKERGDLNKIHMHTH